MTNIAPIDTITKNIEYLNPAEYEPVVILPKNNPETQDCTSMAIPNNPNLDFASDSNVPLLISSISSCAPKLVKDSITNNVVNPVIAISINQTITYGFKFSLFVFSIVCIFSATPANVIRVSTFPPPDEIISNNTWKLLKI